MTPIAPLITGFMREYMPQQRGYSPHSCETYAHSFRLLFAFASPPSVCTRAPLCSNSSRLMPTW